MPFIRLFMVVKFFPINPFIFKKLKNIPKNCWIIVFYGDEVISTIGMNSRTPCSTTEYRIRTNDPPFSSKEEPSFFPFRDYRVN